MVLSLEQTKTNQAAKIKKLKKRVKKLKGKNKMGTNGLKRLYKVRREKIDADEDLSLINETAQDQGKINDQDLFGVHDLDGDEVFMDVTIVKNVEQDAKEAKDKGKGIMVEPEKPLKNKDQIALDEEVVRKLEAELKAEMNEEERIAREKNEENIATIEECDDVQATIDANRQCLEIVFEDDDDVAIKATPLSSKSPTIVDYKIYREGKKSYFKIIRVDGNSQNYLTFRTMFKNFNMEDLKFLRSIVKERFKKTKPADDIDNLLFQTLKTMFEHHVEDIILKYQQRAVKVYKWKHFHSCGLYYVTTKNMVYYLLVEKMYPFTNNILHQLWKDVRLQVDYEIELAYDLLRLIKRQINEAYKPE
nr:hypothetical protein [Tanacetum cinerariifolium]